MTSPDGDGSPQRDDEAGGSAESSRRDAAASGPADLPPTTIRYA